MASRRVNARERYLLANYQHLMTAAERMAARSLVAADFDLNRIPKTVWSRIGRDFAGVDQGDPWKLPINICLRLLRDHKTEISVPEEI